MDEALSAVGALQNFKLGFCFDSRGPFFGQQPLQVVETGRTLGTKIPNCLLQ